MAESPDDVNRSSTASLDDFRYDGLCVQYGISFLFIGLRDQVGLLLIPLVGLDQAVTQSNHSFRSFSDFVLVTIVLPLSFSF